MRNWLERFAHRWWWPSLWGQIAHLSEMHDEAEGATSEYSRQLGYAEREIEDLEDRLVEARDRDY